MANEYVDEAADRRDKQRDKERQREIAQRGLRFRYENERLRGFGGGSGPREKMVDRGVGIGSVSEGGAVEVSSGDLERR